MLQFMHAVNMCAHMQACGAQIRGACVHAHIDIVSHLLESVGL